MHIPACESQAVRLVPFSDALADDSPCDYDRAHWIYVPGFYTEYRYILGTRGEKPLICIGINPSTARPGELDNTLRSVERIARNNGRIRWQNKVHEKFTGYRARKKLPWRDFSYCLLHVKTVQRQEEQNCLDDTIAG